MYRNVYNGELRLQDVGKKVELVGWVSKRRNLGSLVFIDLRDRTGIIQLVLDPSKIAASEIRSEYLLHVHGTVKKKAVPNPALKTGEVEVEVSCLEILNASVTPPFIIADETDALEDTRLKYRYLDLRRPAMLEKLQKRAQIVRSTHEFLDAHGFIEVETPILTKSTPGGARDFLVPSRLHPGHFYALPQSPQIYKQLLMIGGLERYYQIAKCFRDEDLRADRQPDFTQIDLEASFLSQDEILDITERMVQKIFKDTINYQVKLPLKRLTFREAFTTYGSDKPDLRFDMPIIDLKPYFANNEGGYFQNEHLIGLIAHNFAHLASRKTFDHYALLARKFKLPSYGYLKFESGVFTGPLAKAISAIESATLIKELKLVDGDVIILASSNDEEAAYFGLGALRSRLGQELNLIDENEYSLLWVVDFPLFEMSEAGRLVAAHHPFTKPLEADIHLLETDPQRVRSHAYDIVINGYEVGGGSIRIASQALQERIFSILGMGDAEIEKLFGFFIEAFQYGTPPHGGIALGLDRLTMILTKTDNIRDVIAFPKNLSGVSLMSEEPTTVDDEQLEVLKIKINHTK